jgi:hypothetical protein
MIVWKERSEVVLRDAIDPRERSGQFLREA